jgi:hypothetical protein
VVYQYLGDRGRDLPEHFGGLVDALDVVGSFDYASIEKWRVCKPTRIIVDTSEGPFSNFRVRSPFFRNVSFHLRDFGLEKTPRLPQV